MSIALSTTLRASFDDAVTRTREALAEQGAAVEAVRTATQATHPHMAVLAMARVAASRAGRHFSMAAHSASSRMPLVCRL